MALAYLEVVGVVAGSDLERTGAELHIDCLVGDNRYGSSDNGEKRVFAYQGFGAVVLRIDGDGGVAEQRLRPGGGDGDGAVALFELVADVV